MYLIPPVFWRLLWAAPLFCAGLMQAQFTAGNLVVLQVGGSGSSGSAPGSSYPSASAAPVYLKEFSSTGTAGITVAVPSTGSSRLTNSISATSEGFLALSPDGSKLTFAGYDASVGTSSVVSTAASSVRRVVGQMDAAGTFTRIAALTGNAYDGDNIRSAVTDGVNVWTGGDANNSTLNGVRTLPYGSIGASTQISSTVTNVRNVKIFNGQLYVSTASGSYNTINLVGTGTPTGSGQTIVNTIPTGSFDPVDYVVLDADPTVLGPDLVYFTTTSGTTSVYKYSFNGSSWTARGTTSVTSGASGITARFESGQAVLYVASGATSANRLVRIVDAAAYNATISPTSTNLATAPNNTVFRGVSFAPTEAANNTLSFDGVDDYIQLGRSTALRPTAGVTLAAWVKVANWASIGDMAIAGNTQSSGYELYLDAGEKIQFWIHRNGGYATIESSTAGLAAGWHHFAGTFDGQYAKLYVDGALVALNDAGGSYAIEYPTSNSFLIGAEASTGDTPEAGQYFAGELDDLHIFSKALDATEIATLNYPCEATVSQTGLVAKYTFNQGRNASNNRHVRSLVNSATGTGPSGANVDGSLFGFTLTGGSSNWLTSTAGCGGLCVTGKGVGVANGGTTLLQRNGTDFGQPHAGTRVVRTFEAKNTGDYNLTITGVTLSGTHAAQYELPLLPPFPQILAPGSSLILYVGHRPTSAATTTATVTLSTVSCVTGSYSFAVGTTDGEVLKLDGVNDWVDASGSLGTKVAATSLGLPTAAITVEARVRANAFGDDLGIVNFLQDNGSTEAGWVLETGSTGGNGLYWGVRAGGSAAQGTPWYTPSHFSFLGTSTPLATGTWYHVAGTYDGTTMRLYLNGVLQGSSTNESGAIQYLDSWLAIGNYTDDNESYYFNGDIDEVRIWGAARTQAQILAGMECELTGSEADLVAHYNFNTGRAASANAAYATAEDLAGTPQSGLLTNLALTGSTSNWASGSDKNSPVAYTADNHTPCSDAADVILHGNAYGGTAPYAYEWDNGLGTGQQQSATGFGSLYSLTATDANGCQASAQVVVFPAGTSTPGSAAVPATANAIRTASSQCSSGEWRHFFEAGNLLLSTDDNGENFGPIDVALDGGTALVVSFDVTPTIPYISNPNWNTFTRYWDATPTLQPRQNNVGVRFYYTGADYAALAALSAISSHQELRFYKINDGDADPDPDNNAATLDGHLGVPEAASVAATGYWEYTNAATASTNAWSYGTLASAYGNPASGHYAEYLVAEFSGGGGGSSPGPGGALPLAWLGIEAQWVGEDVRIDWHTADERGLAHFDVERAPAGSGRFESMAQAPATGQPGAHAHHAWDAAAPAQTLEYRIRATDHAGHAAYSPTALLAAPSPATQALLTAYPNPTDGGLLHVRHADPAGLGDTGLRLTDLAGKTCLRTRPDAQGRATLDLTGLPAGVYTLRAGIASLQIVKR